MADGGCGCGCDCDCSICCGPGKVPGPAIGNVPCALTLATEAAINALLQLLATPQQLAAFAAHLAADVTLVVNGGAPVVGPAAVIALAATPPEIETTIVVNSVTFGSTNGGTNLTAHVVTTQTVFQNDGGQPLVFEVTWDFVFNTQCLVQSIVASGFPG
jgi:hypothetical protein